jgi:uncharacterized phiE125 gp8 family phage protein
MGYKLKTAPTIEPISSTEAKLHLKIDSDTTDDNLIAALITAARESAENYTGRAFINQTWEATFDEFPDEGDADDLYIELRPSPLSSITSITYKDINNATQTASSSTLYEADTYSIPGRACLKYGQYWPIALEIQNSIVVTFVAGYGAAATAIPGPIKAAILLILGHLYAHRESVNIGNIVTEVPQGAAFLLEPYRVIQF